MPKIGSYSYPAITLTDAIGVSDRIAKEFNGEISVPSLAKALHMAERGGGFSDKVAAVKDYGLLEGRGMLKVTALGERVALPHSPQEADRARAEAFLKVELFQKLFERTAGRVPEEDSFAIFLSDVTAANRMDVAKRAATLRRVFADGVQYARAAADSVESNEVDVEHHRATPRSNLPAMPVRSSSFDTIELLSRDVELRLPLTTESIDIMAGVLEMIRKQIDSESKATGQAGD